MARIDVIYIDAVAENHWALGHIVHVVITSMIRREAIRVFRDDCLILHAVPLHSRRINRQLSLLLRGSLERRSHLEWLRLLRHDLVPLRVLNDDSLLCNPVRCSMISSLPLFLSEFDTTDVIRLVNLGGGDRAALNSILCQFLHTMLDLLSLNSTDASPLV